MFSNPDTSVWLLIRFHTRIRRKFSKQEFSRNGSGTNRESKLRKQPGQFSQQFPASILHRHGPVGSICSRINNLVTRTHTPLHPTRLDTGTRLAGDKSRWPPWRHTTTEKRTRLPQQSSTLEASLADRPVSNSSCHGPIGPESSWII